MTPSPLLPPAPAPAPPFPFARVPTDTRAASCMASCTPRLCFAEHSTDIPSISTRAHEQSISRHTKTVPVIRRTYPDIGSREWHALRLVPRHMLQCAALSDPAFLGRQGHLAGRISGLRIGE